MSTFQPQQQQPQPQQQQQQPVVVYPNPVTKQPTPDSGHHSDGSFGTVFIVLAVIIVVSAIACCLGRLCNRRAHNQKPKQSHSSRPKHGDIEFGNRNFRPKEGDIEFGGNRSSRPTDGDIEFGFDKGVPNGKPNGNRESRGHKPHENGDIKHHHHGHGDDGGPRASH